MKAFTTPSGTVLSSKETGTLRFSWVVGSTVTLTKIGIKARLIRSATIAKATKPAGSATPRISCPAMRPV